MTDSTLAIELRRLVDAADRSDIELTAKELRGMLTREVSESSFAAALSTAVKLKHLRKKRPKVKREKQCYVYVPGSVVPEVGKRGPQVQPRKAEGFMARRRRLNAALAARKARA